ncbi:uncharacterized protein K452DRAFT_290838 [Aplosporella prunicola CBS 121167]|uniref:Uncharacterized protein n=1 Tax=Aplosporella prunicola CBS 121167 TaxID=1176127 RepID=A0A6A6B354_9PEZI|nr:uncharacterized protein K452DRAFT_290838 [Aplosporella prunicola CBS 121167]KAF2138246.1 hypothetical protein K452DRAFT_290838 [Aplosporella prunicola CBS 121167]
MRPVPTIRSDTPTPAPPSSITHPVARFRPQRPKPAAHQKQNAPVVLGGFVRRSIGAFAATFEDMHLWPSVPACLHGLHAR